MADVVTATFSDTATVSGTAVGVTTGTLHASTPTAPTTGHPT